MRGARTRANEGIPSAGIIPAYAGSTWPPSPRGRLPWDHPRVCGEHSTVGPVSSGRPGSSPRMRGALVDVGAAVRRRGIIPAYAGSTLNHSPIVASRWDHPRVCGEHRSSMDACAMMAGSSPRMRGARVGYCQTHRWNRIIPAYAGSTCRILSDTPMEQDHPRVCGEH